MAQNPNSLANLEKGKEHQFTADTAAIAGAKGAAASAETKRARKTIRAELEALLVKHPVDKKGNESDLSYQSAIIVALIKKALTGDTKAFEIIRDTIGEKPAERISLAQIDQETIDKVEKMVMGNDA